MPLERFLSGNPLILVDLVQLDQAGISGSEVFISL